MIDDPAQTISIIANIGVIVGIVFLALELRQNNKLMRAEARRDKTTASLKAFFAVAENADLADIFDKEGKGQELSSVEQLRAKAYWGGLLINLQSTFRDLSPAELEAITKRYRAYHEAVASLGNYWSETRLTFEREFLELMEAKVFYDRL